MVGEGLKDGVVGPADQLAMPGGDAVEGAVAQPDAAVGVLVGFVAAGGQRLAERGQGLVGVVEIVAGLVVAVRPKLGGYLVAAWLAGIITNLLLLGDHYDVALRDFGLLLAALALARLATAFQPTHDVDAATA